MELLFHRYEKLRIWEPHRYGRLSEPIVLDRGRAQGSPRLYPYRRFHDVGGTLFPAVSGGVGLNGGFSHYRPYVGFDLNDTFSAPDTADLNSAYTAGSAGGAIATHFAIPLTKTVTALYFYISAFHGTASLVDDINCEIRSHTSYKPNTGVSALTTGVVNPSSTTGWIKCTLTSTALTANTLYWAIVADADGGATNYATVYWRSLDNAGLELVNYILWQSANTTNGWSSITALRQRTQVMTLLFNDGSAAGHPFTGNSTLTSDTNQKGLYIDGVTEQLSIYGVIGYSGDNLANVTGLKVYSGATGPSGSTVATGATKVSYDGLTYTGVLLSGTYTIPKNTAHRIVYYGGSNFSAPKQRLVGTIGSGTASEVAAAMPGGGTWYSTVESSGSWSDTTTSFPMMAVLIQDQVGVTPTSTGIKVMPGMRGGFHG